MSEEVLAALPEGVRQRVEALVRAAARSACAQAEVLDFHTWLAAARVPQPVAAGLGVDHEHLRAAIRVQLRRELTAAWPSRTMDAARPDVIVHAVVESARGDSDVHAALEANPVFVAGRYRKEVRGLSQTVFHCPVCRGKRRRHGSTCRACEGSGRLVPESVEDFIRPAIEAALAGADSAFHGAGREDVDVRMLGRGRPFVVTVSAPRRWAIDHDDVARMVRDESAGRVTVTDVRMVGVDQRRLITTSHGVKTYELIVRPDEGVLPADAGARVAALAGTTLAQRTPRRVEARRADRVRRRRVRELHVLDARPDGLRLRVATDPGLYVKEMVSGDGGMTQPSLTSILGVPCTCVELDVVDVLVVWLRSSRPCRREIFGRGAARSAGGDPGGSLRSRTWWRIRAKRSAEMGDCARRPRGGFEMTRTSESHH